MAEDPLHGDETPTLEPALLRLTRLTGQQEQVDLTPHESEVEQVLERGFPLMYFPPALEQSFERETELARSRHLVGVGILWALFSVLYSFLTPTGDVLLRDYGFHTAIRLGVVTPAIVLVTFAIWWGVRPALRELLMMLASVLAPASVIVVLIVSGQADAGAARGGLTIVLLFITVVVRLRFWFAAAACFSLVILQMGVPALLDVPVPGNVLLVLITIAATLVANYTLEREFRLNWLQGVLSRIRGARLADMVEQLQDLSNRDALTGLSNRRALDARLRELSATGERFSVILIDVDHFKLFNDNYGHQVGDDCLRRIAAMLRASLRFTSDSVARMGGEEFAVTLPGTRLTDACTMAERMRKSIMELRIPHAGSVLSVVTISAGVAETQPGSTPISIIARADRALYRAKSGGRNRVEVADSGMG